MTMWIDAPYEGREYVCQCYEVAKVLLSSKDSSLENLGDSVRMACGMAA